MNTPGATVSCKERTHDHGHTNQIPWVNICLVDQPLLSHVSCGFIWDKDHLTLQRSATTTLSLVCSLHARKVLELSQVPESCQVTGWVWCLLAVTKRTYLEMEVAPYHEKESSRTVLNSFIRDKDLDLLIWIWPVYTCFAFCSDYSSSFSYHFWKLGEPSTLAPNVHSEISGSVGFFCLCCWGLLPCEQHIQSSVLPYPMQHVGPGFTSSTVCQHSKLAILTILGEYLSISLIYLLNESLSRKRGQELSLVSV